MKTDPQKLYEWKRRSAEKARANRETKVRKRSFSGSKKLDRKLQEACYSVARDKFLREHTVCPVTGEATTQVHHSAKREGRWLLIQRYWIAVSAQGHEWIEANKAEAEELGLMARIRQSAAEHITLLASMNVDLQEPVFYRRFDEVRKYFSKEEDIS